MAPTRTSEKSRQADRDSRDIAREERVTPQTPADVRMKWTVGALLTGGIALASAVVLHDSGWSDPAVRRQFALRVILLALAVALATATPIRRILLRVFDRLRNVTPARRAWIALLVWVIASAYLGSTAYSHGHDLYPRLHDECSYMIGAHILAKGKLWLPQHELADFFESFHILTRPAYTSIYFPGTALLNAPGVWLKLPTWTIPVVLAGLATALAYRIAAELIDGLAGLLVALMILATPQFRIASTDVLSEVPAMVLGLATIWAWLHWHRQMNRGWAIMIGAFAGWAAITRPVDAMVFALPVGVAMVLRLIRREGPHAPSSSGTPGEGWGGGCVEGLSPARTAPSLTLPRNTGGGNQGRAPGVSWLITGVMVLIGAAPFLAIQLIFNLGVTGKPLVSPYVLYLRESQPGSTFGTGAVQGNATPQSTLPQKQVYYRWLLTMDQAQRERGRLGTIIERLDRTARFTLPNLLLLILLPIGIVFWRSKGAWAALAVLPLFIALYALNPFFLPRYVIPLTGIVAIYVAMGGRALGAAFPGRDGFAIVSVTLSIFFLSVAALPEVAPDAHDSAPQTPILDDVQKLLAGIHEPAVVLFRFSPDSYVHEEPVYNWNVAWPDDAPIVRAHDLGARDGEILAYYAKRQPQRAFYLFDRADGKLTRLGSAAEAAQRLKVTIP
ncbi:MAG TPA: glycosyltransferase family 39 protein [Humisphaera sp.]|jgi:hypothetical protein|nr:glycosyltransferase family 39 protein [Humisphaera sp.]